MHLIFERGDYDAPVGHALVYFRADDGTVLATYVCVPPIQFDIGSYVPKFLAGAMEGMDLGMGSSMVATPLPPIPEQVESVDYLQSLAARRQDDLVFAGATMVGDPTRLLAETAEAAREYGDLYSNSSVPEAVRQPDAPSQDADAAAYADLSERERLDELTTMTGRLRDALRNRETQPDVERQMRALAGLLPAKYRANELVDAAATPGEQGEKLAMLYLERSYKLFNEEYLDLERIDRDIEAIGG